MKKTLGWAIVYKVDGNIAENFVHKTFHVYPTRKAASEVLLESERIARVLITEVKKK